MLVPAVGSAAAEHLQLLAHLKASLVRCGEAELVLVSAWVQAELRRGAVPGRHLRLLRSPSAYRDPGASPGAGEVAGTEADRLATFVALAGRVRRELHELPTAELLLLHGWVRDRLAHLGG